MSLLNKIMSEINTVISQVSDAELDQAEDLITKDKRIFILGAGRSGLMAKGFAMRLMHIGYTVFVIGETITPSIAEGDILVSVSGSGSTKSVLEPTVNAKKIGVRVIGVTSNKDSQLATVADETIVVPGATKNDDSVKSIQLLSTLFDQSVHITLDALVLKISLRDNISNEQAKTTHSNLE